MPQLGFLKLNVRREEPPPDEHRVVALFKNRAELKKAYAELQEEIYRLKDRIKQQEGATQRVQELLGGLEARLALAETAYPALVFYQLRGLWQCGRELLEQLVGELSSKQEERERKLHLAECNRQRFPRQQACEGAVRQAEQELGAARERMAAAEQARAKLTRFWQYFARRRAEHELVAAQAGVGIAEQALGTARAALDAFEAEALPEYPGLSVEARRAINLATIACAEVLCARLIKTPLVQLAREASQRREAGDDYGDRERCEALMGQIALARKALQDRTNLAQDIKARTDRIRQAARYRAAADTAPTPESVAFSEGDALAGPGGGAAAARMPNVLAEDTWDIFRVLLR